MTYNKEDNMTEVERIVDEMGFVICEFGPSPHDVCECCMEYDHQLYYHRTDYFVDEGEYFCLNCILVTYHQNIEDYQLNKDGIDKIPEE